MTPRELYLILFKRFGPQHWWPAETPFEVCVGAMLATNTSWSNAEKAIANLKKLKMLTVKAIAKADLKKLENAVKPSGFYRQKARRLKDFAAYVLENYGSVERMLSQPTGMLRRELLSLKGIGPETADSMLLYAAGKPVFVVDAYTFRLAKRLRLTKAKTYDEMKAFFERELPAKRFNEMHALIVRLAKENCRKKPRCEGCPVKGCRNAKL